MRGRFLNRNLHFFHATRYELQTLCAIVLLSVCIISTTHDKLNESFKNSSLWSVVIKIWGVFNFLSFFIFWAIYTLFLLHTCSKKVFPVILKFSKHCDAIKQSYKRSLVDLDHSRSPCWFSDGHKLLFTQKWKVLGM